MHFHIRISYREEVNKHLCVGAQNVHLTLTGLTGVVQHRKFLAGNKAMNRLRETKCSPLRFGQRTTPGTDKHYRDFQ